MDPHLHGWNPSAAPQQASGVRRFLPVLGAWRAAGLYGGVALGVIGILQISLSNPHRPSDVIGEFYGAIVAAEQNAARSASVKTQKQIADANAEAQAKGQEQVLVAQQALQYGMLTALPALGGSIWFQIKCMVGVEAHDLAAGRDCNKAAHYTAAVGQVPINSINGAGGPASVFGTSPQGNATVPAAAAPDAAPLSQAEYNRMARLETLLSPAAVERAQEQLDRSTNRGERRYLGRLAAAAGEAADDNGPSKPLHVIYDTAPRPRGPLPASVVPH